jgi:zinc protease
MFRTMLACGLILCSYGAAPPTTKIFPYAYDQHDLPNGLRLITIPTDYPNVVSIYIVVQTGSRNEVEPGKSGFAHLFEHMMFRGTPQYPPAAYEDVLKNAGAASNASTWDDFTAYHTTLSKEDLDKMLRVEADRFEHLEYSPAVLRTESLAVLGEYNKNSSSPTRKLSEVLRDTAFDKHTYKHTTMGYLRDVKAMPEQFEYSKEFFARYYRPEYTTIIVAGDVKPAHVRAVVEKYWGGWKRGSYKPQITPEPPQNGPRSNHVNWPSPTLPYIAVAFRAPAYSDVSKDGAALDLIGYLGFSQNSDLYQRLVIQDQVVDALSASAPDHVDPYLFTVTARVKKPQELKAVQDDILSALNGFKDTLVSPARLDAVKKHLRYSFALELDNSESIADSVAHFVALRRTPATINKVFELYRQITPEDIRNTARKYFVESGRTIVTLTGSGAK